MSVLLFYLIATTIHREQGKILKFSTGSHDDYRILNPSSYNCDSGRFVCMRERIHVTLSWTGILHLNPIENRMGGFCRFQLTCTLLFFCCCPPSAVLNHVRVSYQGNILTLVFSDPNTTLSKRPSYSISYHTANIGPTVPFLLT